MSSDEVSRTALPTPRAVPVLSPIGRRAWSSDLRCRVDMPVLRQPVWG